MEKSEYLIRYLSLGKFIDLLTTKEIFLSRIDKFEDKTEGEWFGIYLVQTTDDKGNVTNNKIIIQ